MSEEPKAKDRLGLGKPLLSCSPIVTIYETDVSRLTVSFKKVSVKKLYNHTSWRRTYNRYIDNTDKYGVTIFDSAEELEHKSVEEVGLAWLGGLDENGTNAVAADTTAF